MWTSFFWDVMLCRLVVTDVSGQSIVSIFKGQATQVFSVWLTLIRVCSLPRLLVTDVSGQPICPSILTTRFLKMSPLNFFRNVGSLTTYLRCETFQKTEDPEIYVAPVMSMLNILSGTPGQTNLSRGYAFIFILKEVRATRPRFDEDSVLYMLMTTVIVR
jgi:hypothetical protein